MRIRTIKPEFFKHDTLGALPPVARILFIGLWCLADCAGRLEDRPKRIKVEVLPYDDVDVDALLTELQSHGLIVRYSAEGHQLIAIPAFVRHQRISGKESEVLSRYPAPNIKNQSKRVKRKGSNGEAPEKQPGSNKEAPGIPGNGRETEGKGNDTAFAVFWEAYPKKKSKTKAEQAFEKVDVDIGVLLAAIDRQRRSDDWAKQRGQFIPHPATWLNGRRWEDVDTVDLPFSPSPSTPQELHPDATKTIQEIHAEAKAKRELEDRRLAGEIV